VPVQLALYIMTNNERLCALIVPSCACPVEQEGCQCWHRRAVLARVKEDKTLKATEEQVQAAQQVSQEREVFMLVDGKPVNDETYNRVMNVKPARISQAKSY